MALIRTILALVVLLILVHIGLVYTGIEAGTNAVTEAVYGLGRLLESPAALLLEALPLSEEQRRIASASSFYAVALTAAGGYLVLYLLLGVGRR